MVGIGKLNTNHYPLIGVLFAGVVKLADKLDSNSDPTLCMTLDGF
ncbi:MAG: hypothetical protein OEV55_06985 [candidate division Zixibacteria bacterium]|nr:hypothetical protein [candidate division Zixibacteria bacterium]